MLNIQLQAYSHFVFSLIFTDAEFSISEQASTFQANEADEGVTICVELTSMIQLGLDITLELTPSADGTAELSDFDSSTLAYTFFTGSGNGDLVCNTVGITRDGTVENTEDFSVLLALNPPNKHVRIEISSATISITDSDSEFVSMKMHVAC